MLLRRLLTIWRASAQRASKQSTRRRTWSQRQLLSSALGGGAVAWACQQRPSRCEVRSDVRVVTYNVLSPPLVSPDFFPTCAPEDLDSDTRFARILARLEQETAAEAVLGLQEVDLGRAGQLHAFFAQKGYVAVFAQYGHRSNGYMGVMLAWPSSCFEVRDVEICRLSDTAPGKMWPKAEPKQGAALLNPYGFLTKGGLKDVLGCWPPVERMELGSFEWDLARQRSNEVIFVRLRPRGSESAFVVATYHMPCLYGTPEKVRVMNIHAYLLLRKLHSFAGEDPAILMGDFNVKPQSSPYRLLCSGGCLKEAAKADPEELQGLQERLPPCAVWPLASAYCSFHGREPLFTNFAQNKLNVEPFVETLDYIWFTPGRLCVIACPALPESKEEVAGPFPNRQEPSDHVLVGATLRLEA